MIEIEDNFLQDKFPVNEATPTEKISAFLDSLGEVYSSLTYLSVMGNGYVTWDRVGKDNKIEVIAYYVERDDKVVLNSLRLNYTQDYSYVYFPLDAVSEKFKAMLTDRVKSSPNPWAKLERFAELV